MFRVVIMAASPSVMGMITFASAQSTVPLASFPDAAQPAVVTGTAANAVPSTAAEDGGPAASTSTPAGSPSTSQSTVASASAAGSAQPNGPSRSPVGPSAPDASVAHAMMWRGPWTAPSAIAMRHPAPHHRRIAAPHERHVIQVLRYAYGYDIVLNGSRFSDKDACTLGWVASDRVEFLVSKLHGVCVDAVVYNVRRHQTCELWCR